MTKRVAIIPARGGSKRIPRKNIRPFLGRPMISYPLKVALDSGLFDRVIVSTDDSEVAAIARDHGAETPFVRPPELSDDHTGTAAVVVHALQALAEAGFVADQACCLYATTPLVMAEDLQGALALMERSDARYAFAAGRFSFPIQRAVKLDGAQRISSMFPEFISSRSQDLEPAYHDAGQFCWGSASAFIGNEPIFSSQTVAYVLPDHRVQDIDTLEDWTRAELLYRMLHE